jgi:hypothetical protein
MRRHRLGAWPSDPLATPPSLTVGAAQSHLRRRRLTDYGFGADRLRMTRPPLDPARGAEAARKLKSLGVKGILVKAAELGYITQVTCRMRECFCPEELGGARYFEPVVTGVVTDWMPTHHYFPLAKRDGAVELSTTRSLPTASATGSTIRYPSGGQTREISRESEKPARRPPRANASPKGASPGSTLTLRPRLARAGRPPPPGTKMNP